MISCNILDSKKINGKKGFIYTSKNGYSGPISRYSTIWKAFNLVAVFKILISAYFYILGIRAKYSEITTKYMKCL